MSEETPVTRELREKAVAHRFFRHPGQVKSLEQAAEERGQRPGQIVRSIVFRLSEDEFIMVLVAGPRQISWPALREYLGVSRMTMASREEVQEVTGYELGAVSPFGLPGSMRIIVDESVLEEEEVSIGSGARNTTVILRRDDLMRALGEVEVGKFGEK